MAKRVRVRSIETDIFGFTVGQAMINSKKKGDNNEREACKWLFTWTGQKFIRTPSSGGRRLENASNFCGDVVCENEKFKFKFAVETKHLKSITYTRVLRNNSKVFTICRQAIRDADRAKKKPMLLLRQNNDKIGTYVVFFFGDDGMKVSGICNLLYYGKVDDFVIYGFDSDEVLSKLKYSEFV